MALRYHVRDSERAVESREDMLGIIARGKHMTIAIVDDGHPYLVSLNYSFDSDRSLLYFHCAREGRKLDALATNPEVWGQVMEDLGSLAGRCDYGYRTVMFWGKASIVDDVPEKKRALEMMIDRLEPEPAEMRRRMISDVRLRDVTVVRIVIEGMTGKQSLP